MWRYIDVQADWRRKLDQWSGSQRHSHFVGFFNVPVQASTRSSFLYGYSEKLPHLVAFYNTLGIRRTYSRLNPPGPHGADKCQTFSLRDATSRFFSVCIFWSLLWASVTSAAILTSFSFSSLSCLLRAVLLACNCRSVINKYHMIVSCNMVGGSRVWKIWI